MTKTPKEIALEQELKAERQKRRQREIDESRQVLKDTACIIPGVLGKMGSFVKELGTEIRQIGKDYRNAR